ncbi:MAG: hypothetical protein JWM80_5274 [Cyanobacteria bacterium RYN_339]|nr:hypothetical protein [Cyanobacteria bacterium RYN_339]
MRWRWAKARWTGYDGRAMKRFLPLFLALSLLACKPEEKKATAPSPSPTAAMSLADALPSAMPSPVLPKMPAPVAGRFVFFDDFENGTAKWRMEGGAGGLGWHHLKTKSCGGLYTMILGTATNGEFKQAKAAGYLVAVKPVDLTGTKKPQLQYDLKGANMPPDVITIRPEIRRAGGAWQPIGAVAEARYPVVVTFTADLIPYAGSVIDLRFRGEIKGGDQPSKGVFLDDVHVVESNR